MRAHAGLGLNTQIERERESESQSERDTMDNAGGARQQQHQIDTAGVVTLESRTRRCERTSDVGRWLCVRVCVRDLANKQSRPNPIAVWGGER